MKHGVNILCLSTLALLCGCGGGDVSSGSADPAPRDGGIAGNWQFNLASNTSPAKPSATMSGSIVHSGGSLTATMHIDSPPCFDRLSAIELSGTQTGSNLSLTSAPVDGQIIAVTASLVNNALTGTYAIDGGCANGDQGNITGLNVPSIAGTWRVIFDVNEQHVFLGTATMTQGSARPDGSFGLTGKVETNNTTNLLSCFLGTIASGTFPSPSYIVGTSLALEIQTDDGTVTFLGGLKQDGEIWGHHTVSGGTCDGYSGGACFGPDPRGGCSTPPY